METQIGTRAEIKLAESARERYRFAPAIPVRIVETSGGVLVIPLNNGFEDSEVARELEDWQSLGIDSWSAL